VSEVPIVYLGPSLPKAEAERLLAAEYRPPVRRGDLPASCPGRAVLIIDGEFGQSRSVSPKEILRLLDQGTRVIGASSMGALRAAELRPFGMEGCGWVFEAYHSGRIVRDDEVALTYSPLDLEPLTVPLVNVRYWLESLQSRGLLETATARRMLRLIQRLFFAERTPGRIQALFEEVAGTARFQELLRATGGAITDIKAADAQLALTRAALLPADQQSRKELFDGH
jgi:TfuA protein